MTVRVFFDPHRVEQLAQQGIRPRRQLASGQNDVAQAKTSLELVEENARLRAEVTRLRQENQRLSGEITRLSAGAARAGREERVLDDSAQRFSLIELDL